MQDLLRELLNEDASPKLTLQIPSSLDAKARSLRIRHQLEAAVADLDARGAAPPERDSMLERAQAGAADPALAKARSGTGAVYVSAGEFSRSALWPAPLAERTFVSSDFFLADVVDLIDPALCYVLMLSKGGVRLYRADPLEIDELALSGVPASLAEASEYLDQERQLQFHQSQSIGRGGTVAMYHGHGIGEGRDIEELRNYLRAVDTGVQAAVAGAPAPMALVGADDLPAEYSSLMANGSLVDTIDRRNPDGLTNQDLRGLADRVLARSRAAEAAAFRDRMGDLVGAGRASTNLQAIVGAALHGRIETLLVGPSYGGSDNAVNRAVTAVLRHKGRAMADSGLAPDVPLAALFRY